MLLLYRRELPQTLGINVKEKNLPIEQKKKVFLKIKQISHMKGKDGYLVSHSVNSI